VLIQAVDSIIDVYADEDSSYDVAVFRQKKFLARLAAAVPGVRAAVSAAQTHGFRKGLQCDCMLTLDGSTLSRFDMHWLAQVKKVDKKRFPELRGRADGALENLVAFVDYRRQFE
jgi:hypothetical protein